MVGIQLNHNLNPLNPPFFYSRKPPVLFFSPLVILDGDLVLVSVFSDEVVGATDQEYENGGGDQAWNTESKLNRRKKSTDNVLILKKRVFNPKLKLLL